jgi:hypothetical protein
VIRRLVVAIAAMALVLTPLTGCESSQNKNKRLAKNGTKAFKQKGLVVGQQSADVKVLRTAVIQDANGAATVVELRNSSAAPLIHVPISIDVLGADGKSVFKNDAPGLEGALVSAPLIEPKADFIWVHDQVTPSAPAKSVDVKVGGATGKPPADLPKLEVAQPTLKDDPISGTEASGTVTNKSTVEQKQLIVYCVAWRGSKAIAAGRSEIQRLRPGQKLFYHVYFIGNPKGGTVTVAAPPTVLQ